MTKMSITLVGLAICLSACGNPSSQSDPKRSGAHRYFIPAKHVEPSSKPLPSKAATQRDGLINLIV